MRMVKVRILPPQPIFPSSSLLKNPEFVIPNGVCEVRNLSFLSVLIEEGFLASLGMTAMRIFQQPAKNAGIGSGGCFYTDCTAFICGSISQFPMQISIH